MTDFISTPTPEEVKTKSSQAMFYIRKIHANPEFYANEKKRIKEYKLQRYASDPEYAEKMRMRAIDSYYNYFFKKLIKYIKVYKNISIK